MVDNNREFLKTTKSMKIMGFGDEGISAVLRIASAVLHVGNMAFRQEKKRAGT